MRQVLHLWLAAWLLVASITASADAPDFALTGLDGKQHHLGEYIGRGKWVVFNVWGPRCPPCLDEMPELVAFHEEHQDKDAMVVGMALDFPSFGYAKQAEVETFVEENFVSFPVLLGDGNAYRQFGLGPLKGVPTTLVFTPSGKLVAVQVGTVTQQTIERFLERY